jgi:hypothetical protein
LDDPDLLAAFPREEASDSRETASVWPDPNGNCAVDVTGSGERDAPSGAATGSDPIPFAGAARLSSKSRRMTTTTNTNATSVQETTKMARLRFMLRPS